MIVRKIKSVNCGQHAGRDTFDLKLILLISIVFQDQKMALDPTNKILFYVASVSASIITGKSRLQNSLFFLSFFCCSVLEISMREVGMCDARIKGSHTRREGPCFWRLSPVPLVIFTLVMIRFQPRGHTLKYGLFCSLWTKRFSIFFGTGKFNYWTSYW